MSVDLFRMKHESLYEMIVLSNRKKDKSFFAMSSVIPKVKYELLYMMNLLIFINIV